nr:MAG TPA: hypothetical protein [Bacteriophage sp.]
MYAIIYCPYFEIIIILFTRIRYSLRDYKSPIYVWARSSIVCSGFIKTIIINIVFVYITVNIIAIFVCLIGVFARW